MKLLKNRIISLALAFVFCIGASLLPANNTVLAAGNANDYIVRVGMYADTTTDSRLFSALTQSSKGFEIGYSSGDRFIPLLPLSYKDIIILPNVNANIDENGTLTAGEGNIGAYSTILGNYSSYSKAMTKAKSLGGFVAVVDGGFQVRINPRNDAGKHPNGATAMPTENGITVTDTKGNVILVWADEKRNFALQGKQGARVSFPMLHRSGAVNTYDYMGFFEYSVQDGKLFMVNCLGLEDYTKCVMANEIGTNVSKETRKAFSVLARTVPLGKKHKKSGFDVCSHSACCQVYQGLKRMGEENNHIVDSTRGMINKNSIDFSIDFLKGQIKEDAFNNFLSLLNRAGSVDKLNLLRLVFDGKSDLWQTYKSIKKRLDPGEANVIDNAFIGKKTSGWVTKYTEAFLEKELGVENLSERAFKRLMEDEQWKLTLINSFKAQFPELYDLLQKVCSMI